MPPAALAQSVGGLGLGVVVSASLAVSSWTAVAGSGSLRLWLGAVLRSWVNASSGLMLWPWARASTGLFDQDPAVQGVLELVDQGFAAMPGGFWIYSMVATSTAWLISVAVASRRADACGECSGGTCLVARTSA